jgi:3-hydroxymyristoyl/3-hydroxydecanoyl-(acyl carrier protein) dehydratase
MPGVLILEAMGQTGGLLLLNYGGLQENKLVMFVGMDNVKFRKPVMPGDQLVMEVVMAQRRFNTFTLEAKAYVDGKLAAEAQLRAAVVDKEAKQS